jgi:hypothetical protein
MLFLVSLVLAPVLLVGYLVLARRHFRRPARPPLGGAAPAALTFALVAFPVWCIVLTWRLIVDPSSTAVIGIYAVPLLAALLAGSVFAAVWSLVVLARAGTHGRAGLGKALLAVAILAGLSMLIGSAVRQELLLREAERSSTSPARLAELFARETVRRDSAVVAALAANPSTPPEVLRRLAAGEAEVAFRLAQNPATPPGLLTSLASRTEASVRSAVAANPRTPAATLVLLAGDGELAVRRVVARNAAVPPAALAALARDADRDTRLLVASNPSIPASALRLLAQDPDEKVRTYAERALQNPSRR